MPWRPEAPLIAMVRPVSTAKTLSASVSCLCHRVHVALVSQSLPAGSQRFFLLPRDVRLPACPQARPLAFFSDTNAPAPARPWTCPAPGVRRQHLDAESARRERIVRRNRQRGWLFCLHFAWKSAKGGKGREAGMRHPLRPSAALRALPSKSPQSTAASASNQPHRTPTPGAACRPPSSGCCVAAGPKTPAPSPASPAAGSAPWPAPPRGSVRQPIPGRSRHRPVPNGPGGRWRC